MDDGHLLIVLAVAAVTLTAAAGLRRVGIPTPIVLVVAGLAIGFLPFVPDVSLSPKVALDGFLPVLVYQASFETSPRALVRLARPIGALAVGLVVLTAGLVAVTAHLLAGLSWPMALVLGTAVGPTDSVAATSIAARLGLPRRLTTMLAGEALLNDGTALVLYAAAVTAAVSGHFSAPATVGRVVYGTVAGAAVGLAVAVVVRAARRRLDDPPMEIAVSLFAAYAAYLPAEILGASGVLAAVTAGLYLGWHSSGSSSARSRLQAEAFWSTLVFLVDGALFILVGLSFHTFRVAARGPLLPLLGASLAVTGVVVGTRLLTVLGVPPLVATLGRRLRPTRPPATGPPPRAWRLRLLVGWAGMRGGITLAAVLAVPATTRSGAALAGRDQVITAGFVVILVTLLAQGLSLPVLARRLRIGEHPAVADQARRARLVLADAALEVLADAAGREEVSPQLLEALRARYEARAFALRSDGGADRPQPGVALRRQILDAQRRALLELRRTGRVGMSELRSLERELDLEEARALRG